MKLSKRIYKLAESITYGCTAADIGTDHGYVPMLLIKTERSPHVIMSDISADSLSKAKETFSLTGLSDKVKESDFRVGDGLSVLKKGEVDELIIAGLGGHTIARILEADKEKSASFKRLILQPRKHSGTLRYYLCMNGWKIESEALAPEGKFACEIITAVPADGSEAAGIDPKDMYPEDDIRWKYPEMMAVSEPELAGLRIKWKINSIETEINNLKRANASDNNATAERLKLIEKLDQELAYLKGLI